MNKLRPDQRRVIDRLNALDTDLYAFAKKLLFQRYVYICNGVRMLLICNNYNNCRFERLKAKDSNFETRFNHLGNVGSRNGVTEFNWDGNLEDSSTEN